VAHGISCLVDPAARADDGRIKEILIFVFYVTSRNLLATVSLNLALAIVMNRLLYSYDHYYSTRLADQIVNHSMNIGLWFVVFSAVCELLASLVVVFRRIIVSATGVKRSNAKNSK